ncbi:uncharacterized protein DS421_19g652980 [Arachis hypogaea]|uniref:Uncharacterized protein n=1 Tax=Arachis hypogaea TaxID=3818 RepID=A0A6B9VB45_ARAHY|nr:uncharacterized protein DS421_19g652980 [Arachis hypogaea]
MKLREEGRERNAVAHPRVEIEREQAVPLPPRVAVANAQPSLPFVAKQGAQRKERGGTANRDLERARAIATDGEGGARAERVKPPLSPAPPARVAAERAVTSAAANLICSAAVPLRTRLSSHTEQVRQRDLRLSRGSATMSSRACVAGAALIGITAVKKGFQAAAGVTAGEESCIYVILTAMDGLVTSGIAAGAPG